MEERDILDLSIQDTQTQGVVKSIDEPQLIETKFGKSYRVVLHVDANGADIPVSILINERSVKRGILHPRSNLYKILTRYGVKKLSDLVGKKVELRVDARGFHRLFY